MLGYFEGKQSTQNYGTGGLSRPNYSVLVKGGKTARVLEGSEGFGGGAVDWSTIIL